MQNWYIEHGVEYVKDKMPQNSLIATGYSANVCVSIFLKVDINLWSPSSPDVSFFSSAKEWLFWFSHLVVEKILESYICSWSGWVFL